MGLESNEPGLQFRTARIGFGNHTPMPVEQWNGIEYRSKSVSGKTLLKGVCGRERNVRILVCDFEPQVRFGGRVFVRLRLMLSTEQAGSL